MSVSKQDMSTSVSGFPFAELPSDLCIFIITVSIRILNMIANTIIVSC